METVTDFIFLGSKITADGDCSHEIKRCLLLGRKVMTNLDSILKSRDITNKGPSSQGYGFSNSHVWIWELDYKESWVPKNWCFWTVVLEKTLESPLDCKEIQPVLPKGDLAWVFIGGTGGWSWNSSSLATDLESWFIWKDPDDGKDWGQEEKGQQRMRWLDGITDTMDMGLGRLRSWWWTGGLECCSSWGCKKLDTTEWLHWTESLTKKRERTRYYVLPSGRIYHHLWSILAKIYK